VDSDYWHPDDPVRRSIELDESDFLSRGQRKAFVQARTQFSFGGRQQEAPSILKRIQKEMDETLEATFWLFDREPGFDSLTDTADDLLKKFKDDLGIYPFKDRDKRERVMTARYEFPKYGEEYQYKRAIFVENQDVWGWIQFLGGFPVDDCEMLVIIGQYTTEADQVYQKPGNNKIIPPMQHFFRWPEDPKILFNLTALPIRHKGKVMSPNIEDPKPDHLHWWYGVNFADDAETMKYPIPGEFLGWGVRIMVDKPWGRQDSSPFIYSGNFMDTVFLTSAEIVSIEDPIHTRPYSLYTVRWRGREQTEVVRPSDFGEYAVGDRVTIMKDVSTEKTTQLWKDDDTENFGDMWQIVPINFYGLERGE
jgi:hypothetical protein